MPKQAFHLAQAANRGLGCRWLSRFLARNGASFASLANGGIASASSVDFVRCNDMLISLVSVHSGGSGVLRLDNRDCERYFLNFLVFSVEQLDDEVYIRRIQ